MSAPVPATRVPPTGKPMTNGFPIVIVFAAAPDVPFWEVKITPPGMDGGDPINTTTQHNVEWRTMAMRILKTLTNSKITANWNPSTYSAVKDLINKETTITIIFPTNPRRSIAFFGGLKSAEPQEFDEQSTEPPTIEMEIVAINCDPDDPNRVEQGPVIS